MSQILQTKLSQNHGPSTPQHYSKEDHDYNDKNEKRFESSD